MAGLSRRRMRFEPFDFPASPSGQERKKISQLSQRSHHSIIFSSSSFRLDHHYSTENPSKKMKAPNYFNASGPFLVLILLSSLAAASATTRHRRLGFFYTRARGSCSAEYWSSVREHWPRMVPPASTVSKVLGSKVLDQRFRSDLTLLESMAGDSSKRDAFAKLLKQGIAALLNSYSRGGYPYRSWEVKSMVIEAMVSKNAAAALSRRLAAANEACT